MKKMTWAFLLLSLLAVGFVIQQPEAAREYVESLLGVENSSTPEKQDLSEQAASLPAEAADRWSMPLQEPATDDASKAIMHEDSLNLAAFYQVNGEVIEREFTWDYNGKRWSFSLRIPRGVYDHYANQERLPHVHNGVFSVYATDVLQREMIAALVDSLSKTASQEGYSLSQTAEFVLAFVQNIKYIADETSKSVAQYTRYPVETLADMEGDCKDKSILYASILREMGIGVVLVVLSGEPGHLAVGVVGKDLPGTYYEHQEARYYYAETTALGWRIGDMPEEYHNQEAAIVPVEPQPLLVHRWESRITGGQLELVATVSNLGSDTAYDTSVYAALDAGEGKVYAQQWSESLDLAPGSKGTYTHYLKVPVGVETRLLVKITRNEYLVDESYSEWFST